MARANNLMSYPNLVLTVSKFMANYYNITGSNLNKLTHNDLNQIFPFLELAAPNELTKENLVTGDVILVIDEKYTILGYVNPFIHTNEMIYEEQPENEVVDIIFEVDNDVDVLEEVTEETLENLNIYELEQLLKLCKANQDYKTRRLVQKELYFRPENHSSEKKTKKLEKVRIKEIRKEDLR